MNAQQSLMNQQPQAPSTNVLSPLQSLLDANGELDFGSMNFTDRIQAFMDFEQKCNMNLINFSEMVLAKIPHGTRLVPIPVIPTLEDCWHGDAAQKMKLPTGHVEPKADFIIKLGNLQGCQATICSEGVETATGTEMYAVKYAAGFFLPDGTAISVTGEGKSQELYYTAHDGKKVKQAHVVESTRKKARRNAIKNLNKIPTSMPQEKFLRPWVILRPVFEAGVSPETDRLIAAQKAKSDASVAALYGQAPAIDVAAETVNKATGEVTVPEVGIQEILVQTENARSITDLEDVVALVGKQRLYPAEYKQFQSAYTKRRKSLETSAAVDAQAPAEY